MKVNWQFWIGLLIWFAMIPAPLFAQDQDNVVQLRTPVHLTRDLNKNWFLASWVIGNVRQSQPDNINLFGGIGYQRNKWWLETLAQRQWSKAGNQWQLNFRFNWKLTSRSNLYAELYPLSTRRTFAETLVIDFRVWEQLKIGGEMENTHKKGTDSLGGGPRISRSLLKCEKVNIAAVGTYHFRNGQEPNFFRVYVITTVRF